MRKTIMTALVASLAAAGVAYAQTGTPNTTTPNPNPGTGSVTPLSNPKGSVANSNTSAAEAAVKEQIRAAGLTGPSNLVLNPDGTWSGRAMKDNAQVAITVDGAGRVHFQ